MRPGERSEPGREEAHAPKAWKRGNPAVLPERGARGASEAKSRASIEEGERMTCKDFIEFLHEYLEEELPQAQRVRFEEHLEICESCVAYLSNYRDTMHLARKAFCDPEGPVPDEVPEELVAAILSARRGR
jgi:hypothetical protein